MRRKLNVFLDTSALLAGLNSPTGAAGVIIAACISGEITWNTKHFMRASIVEVVSFPIMIPGEFLSRFLKS